MAMSRETSAPLPDPSTRSYSAMICCCVTVVGLIHPSMVKPLLKPTFMDGGAFTRTKLLTPSKLKAIPTSPRAVPPPFNHRPGIGAHILGGLFPRFHQATMPDEADGGVDI